MVRRLCVFLVLVTLAASVSGCSALLPRHLPYKQPEQPADGATYYNNYLGLAVTVPYGWYEEEINNLNLTKNPQDGGDLFSLDLYDYGDGGYSIELITIQNNVNSKADEHAELMLFADYYPGASENEYLEWMAEYIEDKTDGEYYYELEDIDTKTVNGRQYTRFVAKVTFADDTVPYYEEYYVSPVNETFFVAYINYWSDSLLSKSAAYYALENAFTLNGAHGASNPIQSI